MRVIIASVFCAFLLCVGYLGFRWLETEYALLPTGEQPHVALIVVVTVAGVLLLATAIRTGSRVRAQQGLLEQRYCLYQVALCTLHQREVPPALQLEINQGLALLGSRAVLRAHRKAEEEIRAHSAATPDAAKLIRRLTEAMRADLGQRALEFNNESKEPITELVGNPQQL
jgi:hypothetical protein